MKIKHILCLTFLSLTSSTVYANNCLAKYSHEFDNKQVNITYDSNRPNSYLINTLGQNTKDNCVTNYTNLIKYIELRYPKTTIKQTDVVIGWNYLAVNKQIIYNYLNSINPHQIKQEHQYLLNNKDIKSYTVSNQADYQFVSIVNNKYACYIHSWFMMATAMAHPDSGINYQCTLINNPKDNLTINQLATESSIVKGILTDNDIKLKLKSDFNNITMYKNLQEKFRSSNDSELNCLSDNINGDNTNFVINQLNKDGTIDITLALTSNIHVCNGIIKKIKINHLTPLIKINQVINNNFQSI